MFKKCKTLVCFCFLFQITGLFAYEVILNFEPEEVSGENLAMVPFEGTISVDPDLVKLFYDEFIRRFISDNVYKPVSLEHWLDTVHGEYSFPSVEQLLNAVNYGRMPVKHLCWGNLNCIEGEYVFTFYWYDIKQKKKSMYQREFTLEEIEGKDILYNDNRLEVTDSILSSILEEFDSRNGREDRLFSKNILIRKTRVSYFQYTRLSGGDEEFSSIPFIQYNNTSLKDGEDFFSDIFEYTFYKTGLVYEYSDKLGRRIKRETPLLTGYQYILDSEILVSKDFSVLKIIVRNPKWPPDDNVVIQYSYPLQDIRYTTLQDAAQKNIQLILFNLLTEIERKEVGIMNFNDAHLWHNTNIELTAEELKAKAEEFQPGIIELIKASFSEIKNEAPEYVAYINGICYGKVERLNTVMLPFGSSDIRINSDFFKVFVSPYGMNEVYFKPVDSVLMEK